MKKFVFLLFMLTPFLFGDYKLLINTTDNYKQENIISEETIFFGSFDDYMSYRQEIAKKLLAGTAGGAIQGLSQGAAQLAQGLSGGVASGLTGAGVGFVIIAIQEQIDKNRADQRYIELHKITLKDGSTELKSFFFNGNKQPVYTEEEIKDFIKLGEAK
ncbi:hypothetical protein [Sulfurospirillum multivorans]|uniref:Uncharacterized protein n=2 Tax=Sulfurospirillum multivorans TaxID=66821 RepID=A0AA86AIS8_SULMK|nr:hypothetical protein [Sulfurospirillum multivorans]AHJ11311.1 hypothetical protein SMUL_0023 [Sulfurospirillum multivorans DSM 12446]QEH04816.1 hypothetical protein SMN_0022 [Sulfurospirillum multivorans]